MTPTQIDLTALLTRLKETDAWKTGEDQTEVITKTDRMRVVFRLLPAGHALPEHKAAGRVSVQVIEGQVNFTVDAHTVSLKQGTLLLLDPGAPHAVHALVDSAILITVAQ